MQRNWSLIRDLLLAVESMTSTRALLAVDDLDGYDIDEVYLHMELLGEAGLLQIMRAEGQNAISSCYAKRMTWQGYELLDTLRSGSRWEKIKMRLQDNDLPLSLSNIRMAEKRLTQESLRLIGVP